MMKCRDISELLTDYLEGKMSLGERMRFQMHVAVCPPCKRYLQQMKLTVQTLGEVPPLDIPSDVEGELMACFFIMSGIIRRCMASFLLKLGP